VLSLGAGDYHGGEIRQELRPKGSRSSPAAVRRQACRLWSSDRRRPAARSTALPGCPESGGNHLLSQRHRQARADGICSQYRCHVNFPILDTTERFSQVWEMACYFRLPAGRQRGGPLMTARGEVKIASPADRQLARRYPGNAAFARQVLGCARWARAMARELGPRISMSRNLIIDSGVDTDWVRQAPYRGVGPERARHPICFECRQRRSPTGPTGSCTSTKDRPYLRTGKPSLREKW